MGQAGAGALGSQVLGIRVAAGLVPGAPGQQAQSWFSPKAVLRPQGNPGGPPRPPFICVASRPPSDPPVRLQACPKAPRRRTPRPGTELWAQPVPGQLPFHSARDQGCGHSGDRWCPGGVTVTLGAGAGLLLDSELLTWVWPLKIPLAVHPQTTDPAEHVLHLDKQKSSGAISHWPGDSGQAT